VLFNSYSFALFFVFVWAAYWALARTSRLRVWLLLGASYFFYGFWDPRFLLLIVGSTVLDYFVGAAMQRSADQGRRRRLLSISLLGNLGALGFFKYWGFFTQEAARLLTGIGLEPNLPTLQVILPVGISFYTFQTLSYTIDIYRRELEPERDFTRFALFVAFFPQLVAGPIVRARDFLPQIGRSPRLGPRAFNSGLSLICWGLLKKICLADFLGRSLVDPVWADPSAHGSWLTLLGIYGYALQIYGDFSGYSDCAIGVARLLGFDLCKNFDAPYRATSPRDFWRRWHISLSTWLRDYLYIALGGNRGGGWRTQRNLMLTMLLGGLWHGASWMFVLWGGYHGALLALDRRLNLPAPQSALSLWLRRLVTFHLICLGWVFFRSKTPADAWAVLSSLFQLEVTAEVGGLVLLALAFGCLVHQLTDDAKELVRSRFLGIHPYLRGIVLALLLGLLLNTQYLEQPFLYFQF